MKKIVLINLLVDLFIGGFYSCKNDDYSIDNNEVRYISYEEKESIMRGIKDSIINIDTEEDLINLQRLISVDQEQELQEMGYIKLEDIETDYSLNTRAVSIERLTIYTPYTTGMPIGEKFKAKFSKIFCDEINGVAYGANIVENMKIYPNKTYICMWRNAGTFFNLKENQHGGVLPSPNAALKPSKKESFTSGNAERGYDAYRNAANQYILASHMLEVCYEDVKGSTVIIRASYPFWAINSPSERKGYEINFSILTRN